MLCTGRHPVRCGAYGIVVLWTFLTNQLLPVCQQPWWSGTMIQMYFKLYVPRFMAESEFYGLCPSLKLIYSNTKWKSLCVSFQFECNVFTLLWGTASVSALEYFTRLWKACFENPISSGGKMAKLWNMCNFFFSCSCFGVIYRTRSTAVCRWYLLKVL